MDGTSAERLHFYLDFVLLGHEWRTRFLAVMEAVSLTTGLALAETLAVIRLSTGLATISELAAAAAIRGNGASVLVRRLEGRGIVRRQQHRADQRSVHISLTEQGQSLVSDSVLPSFGEEMDELFAPFSNQERAQWLSFLQRVISPGTSKDNHGVEERAAQRRVRGSPPPAAAS